MKKNLMILAALMAVVYGLWDYQFQGIPVLYPLKLLVVFFHEGSHALMTVFTNGNVVEFVVNKQLGGHVLSSGGDRFWTLTAGYLGSLLWGVLIYSLAVHTKYDKVIMGMLGAIIIGISVYFSRDTFTLGFGAATGVAMIVMGKFAPMQANDLALRFIALVNMSYVPLDIMSDTIHRSHLKSDAFMLADEIGYLSTIQWGILWLIISAIIIAVTVFIGAKYEREDVPKTKSGKARYVRKF